MTTKTPCPACGGSGKHPQAPESACWDCNGSGREKPDAGYWAQLTAQVDVERALSDAHLRRFE